MLVDRDAYCWMGMLASRGWREEGRRGVQPKIMAEAMPACI
jgi:hypothetical protein